MFWKMAPSPSPAPAPPSWPTNASAAPTWGREADASSRSLPPLPVDLDDGFADDRVAVVLGLEVAGHREGDPLPLDERPAEHPLDGLEHRAAVELHDEVHGQVLPAAGRHADESEQLHAVRSGLVLVLGVQGPGAEEVERGQIDAPY